MGNEESTQNNDNGLKELIIYVKDAFDSGSDEGKVAQIRQIWNSA